MAFTKPNPGPGGRRTGPTETVMEALANQRRRTVLDVLARLSPTPRGELATHVAAAEADEQLSAVASETVRRVELALHHRHLPKLEDAGLVECPNDLVAATASAPFEVWEFVSDIDAERLDWDGLFRALTDSRCRAVVSALDDVAATTDRQTLAAAAADHPVWTAEGDDAEPHLHHVTLPKLDDGGLLSYDPDTGRVDHGHGDDAVYGLLDALAY